MGEAEGHSYVAPLNVCR